jgi:TonB family protein
MNCAHSHATVITAEAVPELPAIPAPPSRTSRFRAEIPLMSVVTLVLWLGCVVISGVGFTLPYARPLPSRPEAAPVQAEILEVELTVAASPAHEFGPQPANSLLTPPPVLEPIASPPAAAMVAVAEPTPAVAFALPVEGPPRLAAPDQARHAPRLSPTAGETAMPARLQVIAYGEGEGRQPAPDYPRQAVREGQEGIVTVRFSVGEHGRVLAAEAVTDTPWPLLNDAALRAVKQRWRFRPGPARLYEVAIRFELRRDSQLQSSIRS